MPCRLPVDLHTFKASYIRKAGIFSMAKSFNYRKYYKDYYSIEFGREFDIHHIDRNRENNDISNLILLPKTLHQKYHTKLYGAQCACEAEDILTIYRSSYALGELEDFLSVAEEMLEWSGLKNACDNFISYGVKSSDIRNVDGMVDSFLPEGISWK